MIAKSAWGVMTLMAIAVAAYAIAMTLAPSIRGEFVIGMFTDTPIAAPAHLLGGAIALITGALQFSQRIRTGHIQLHRWIGRVYLLSVAASGIAGLQMALSTPGGLPAQTGFSFLAIGWLITTSMAYFRILEKDIAGHRTWMIRSYALTLAAVTLRIYLPTMLAQGLPFGPVYATIAWLCWVPNLVIAEWLIVPWMGKKPTR